MGIARVLSEFVRQALEVFLPPKRDTPDYMQTMTYACKAQSEPVGYDREDVDDAGYRKEQRRVTLRDALVEYRHAEARRSDADNLKYHIDYVTRRVSFNGKSEQMEIIPFVIDGKRALFTLDEAVAELHHIEEIFGEITNDYFGTPEHSHIGGRAPHCYYRAWSKGPAIPAHPRPGKPKGFKL